MDEVINHKLGFEYDYYCDDDGQCVIISKMMPN